jgi:hypothetical protein
MEKRGLLRPLSRRAPSPAMVVACIALTVALGGTSYAAIRLPAGSVGTKQLKRGAVTGVKVRGNTLTGTQINEARLAKVPSARLADRASDAASADTADQATRAPVSRLDYRQSTAVAIPTTGHVRATATCDSGLTAVVGCGKVSVPINSFIVDTNPLGRTGWEATATALTTGTTLTVHVICAQAASTTP